MYFQKHSRYIVFIVVNNSEYHSYSVSKHIKKNITFLKTRFLVGQVKLRDLPGKGSLLVQAMQSGIEFDGLPNVQLFEDINEKPDDPDALKILSEMESEFVKVQLDPKDAAKLYQAALCFGKKYASGDIPKKALMDLVSPMSDELCQAFGLKTSKHLANDLIHVNISTQKIVWWSR